GKVLLEADNWYVPSRLSTEMNRLLETTDTPFGKAVQPLEPYRQTFSVKVLWSPLPDGWERGSTVPSTGANGTLQIPDGLLEHRAILYTREHKPFSEVDEIYFRQLLSITPARPCVSCVRRYTQRDKGAESFAGRHCSRGT